MQTIKPTILNVLPTAESFLFKGVSNSSLLLRRDAICPTSVFIPVAVTTPIPLP